MAFHPKLPPSKSIANRVLTKRAVEGKSLPEIPAHWPEDIHAMKRVLFTGTKRNAGEAGTALRFGLAFAAAQPGETVILTGSKRLLERPIGPLVTALKDLGADMELLEDGWHVRGAELTGGRISLDASRSSQFESALKLVEPLMTRPLDVQRQGLTVSLPYIDMTERVSSDMWPPSGDWSNGFFWAMAAMIANQPIDLALELEGMQGDEAWAEWGDQLGYAIRPDSAFLTVHPRQANAAWVMDLNGHPDLAQPLVAAAVAMGKAVEISGLSTLAHKEVDRMQSLKELLEICQIPFVATETSMSFDASAAIFPESHRVDVSGDHRMAMMWALMSMVMKVEILGSSSVAKSDPNFWNEWGRWCTEGQRDMPILKDES